MNEIDPKIPITFAITFAASQSNLARVLDVSKTSVSDWVTTNREFLPPLQAWRLLRLNPGRFENFLPPLADLEQINAHAYKLSQIRQQ